MLLLFFFYINTFFIITHQLECFIGVALGSHAQDVTGAIMSCTGMCSNVTLTIHNTVATIFTCDPFDVCATIEIDNECNIQWLDISMCCCSNQNYCNVKEWIMEKVVPQSPSSFTQNPLPSNIPPQHTIGCYVGIDFYQRMQVENYIFSKKFINIFKDYLFIKFKKFKLSTNLENFNLFIQHILVIIFRFNNIYNSNNFLLNNINKNFTTNANESVNPLDVLYNGQGLVIKMNCTGSCANTTLGDAGMVYFCDPEYFCMTHNLEDKCNNMDFLLKSCCCNNPFCNMDYNNFDNDNSTLATFFPIETTPLTSNIKTNNNTNFLLIIIFNFFLIFLK